MKINSMCVESKFWLVQRILFWSGFAGPCLVCLLLFSSSAQAQEKNPVKHSNSRALNTTVPKSESKHKPFETYEEFVIVDRRAGAVEIVVEEEGAKSMKEELETRFPAHTIFATSSPFLCIIGVDGSADANYIWSQIQSKTSKQVKKTDLLNALSRLDVKLNLKEK